ncbi:MAG: ABC transporter ATP-binding protein [Sharpea porci]
MISVIKIHELTKQYGHQLAVNNLSFELKKGEICGLVGENGAGKTTLIRMLSGLIFPSSGFIEKEDNVKIGALIESPALQPDLSAYDNLRYMAMQNGVKNVDKKIKDSLELVGLAFVDAKKKAKDFSLGMRQRLAIALAILDNPDLLILDEPINGLDPAGIKEMRSIIKTLRDRFQMTILISSHILSELEMVVDRYIIMHKGKLIKQFTTEELNKEISEQLLLHTINKKEAVELFTNKHIAFDIKKDYITLPVKTDVMALVQLLLDNNIVFDEIYRNKVSFEEYYFKSIQDGGKND